MVGPGMVLRPALPHCPAAGKAKAAVLKFMPAAWIARPVAFARTVLLTPVPATCELLPPTVAVNGVPDRMFMFPLTSQSLMAAPRHPETRAPPPRPSLPEVYWNVMAILCGMLKLDKARSAERFS